ncbi:protein kinase [Legionella sp. km772]|uniref:protein kinase domain-containing protein n=1 Tax=Legionella sp. km772 TaxID=2498111 RepID=UPI000F8CB6E2|nr:protein kinase [Legionella sp. km772]RUR08592.1 hypothetical protein ELY15_10490 [Legionella sp. km772]
MGAAQPSPLWTLFPVQQENGVIVNYACDFSDELGESVYKGYECTILRAEQSHLKPVRLKKEELEIKADKPVAIKLYDGEQHPSPYQFYASKIAVFTIDERDVLIMEYLDGIHIHPDHKDNAQLKKLSFLETVDIAWQLVLGLNHLHYRNSSGIPVVHGDIKGENIKIRIKTDAENKTKIDVFYLDMDYAKPITSTPQLIQGTPEHVALEVLDGHYSESSDFFALSPLLLSLFGAYNPFKEIMAFRDSHKHLEQAELIKGFRAITFSAEGLFTHFEKKPLPVIARLVQEFILSMGDNHKKRRPSPDAILEFFTALRQFCLVDPLDQELYILRLCLVAGETNCLTEPKSLTLFFSLDEVNQVRFIKLMTYKQSIALYKSAIEHHASPTVIEALRANIARELSEQIAVLKPPSRFASLFYSPLSKKELQWLLDCYEKHNSADFHAAANEKTRVKLQKCKDELFAPLIAPLIEGMEKKATVQTILS